MTSGNPTENIRRDIMMKFLHSIVWIDDEICPERVDSRGDLFRTFFYPAASVFQKQGFLVHLYPYSTEITDDEDDTFADSRVSDSYESAEKLALNADIVILDWHLGREDPNNSIRLLQRLGRESSIRYIIVLSKFADTFERDLKTSDMLKISQRHSDTSHLFRYNGNAWINNKGTHVIVMKKPESPQTNAEEFGASVIDTVFSLITQANPDYLHWAAVEIAAKLRHSIPEWIQAIPHGTDLALLSELISDKTEAREFIPEHLLEDLAHIAKVNALESLEIANCRPKDWKNTPDSFSHTIATHELDNATARFVRLQADILNVRPEDIKEIRSSSDRKDYLAFIDSQMLLAQFCEIMAKHDDATPTFGSVFVKNEIVSQGAGAQIYVCISQECDCARANTLLFLKAEKSRPGASCFGSTKLFFNGKEYRFTAKAENLETFRINNESRTFDDLNKIGQIRPATTRRILTRFWNHMSRSAINLSTFARIERSEK